MRLALLLALVMTLSGCVTEYSGHRAPKADPQKELQDSLRLARAYIQEGFTARAVKPLKRALEIDPRSAEAYGVMAIVYQIEEDEAQARTHYQKALKLSPSASDIQHNYGAYLYSIGDYAKASTHLSHASADISYRNRATSYQVLGLSELKQDNQAGAESNFLRALRMERGLGLASLELSSLYFKQKKYADARAYYGNFLSNSEQNARSLLLGIRLAKVFEDSDTQASYALLLKKFFPTSAEYKQYQGLK